MTHQEKRKKMYFLRGKWVYYWLLHTCIFRVQLMASNDTTPICLSYGSWRGLYCSNRCPIFLQVHHTRHWFVLVISQIFLRHCWTAFLLSPAPVWYYGDLQLSEAGGDDNRLLVIPSWADAEFSLGIKNPKHTTMPYVSCILCPLDWGTQDISFSCHSTAVTFLFWHEWNDLT